ncbi:MAG TPA: GLPGLI family protein [Bacteroidetes bacterium]|nr:GLPGLI family protein [Bacteroidota bacterium]
MKVGIFLFSFFATFSTVNAQDVVIVYEQSANIENQLKNIKDKATRARVAKHLSNPSYFSLLCKKGASIYKPMASDALEGDGLSLGLGSNSKEKVIAIGKGAGGIYKNQTTKEYLSEENLLGKSFLVRDTLPVFNWVITQETKKIGTLDCVKATTNYQGEKIVAWFTREIPIFDGPRIFYGLPGLIIELHTPNLNFAMISIKELKNDDVKIEKPRHGKDVNIQEYKKIKEERINALKQGQLFGN